MYKNRIKIVQTKLQEKNLDGLLLASNSSMYYLLEKPTIWWQRTSDNNIPILPIEGPYFQNKPDAVLYIPAEGQSVITCIPQMQKEFGSCRIPVEVTYLFNFHNKMRKYVRGKNIAIGAACDKHLGELLEEIDSNIKTVPGETIIEEMRQCKDAEEIALMRELAEFTDYAQGIAVDMLKPGVTAREVENRLIDLAIEHNMPDLPFPPTAHFEKNGTPARSYYTNKDMPLENDSSICFDFGYMIDGYCSDFGRAFYCGKAPKIISDYYKALQKAQVTLIENIRPNVTNIKDMFWEIDRVMKECGCQEYLVNYADIGMLGHQIGIDVHENPWIYTDKDFVLKPGMIMCIEPRVHIPNHCYLRVEDMVLITETGAESLTKFSRDLFELNV